MTQAASLGGPPVEVLKVSSKSNPNACAGALAGVLRQEGVVEVQVVGAGALNQAIKAVAIARGFVAPSGLDLICIPTFADIEIDGENRTAIRLLLEDRHRRHPLTLDMRPVDLDGDAGLPDTRLPDTRRADPALVGTALGDGALAEGTMAAAALADAALADAALGSNGTAPAATEPAPATAAAAVLATD